jgi:phosphatidylinositol phospholipase C delta
MSQSRDPRIYFLHALATIPIPEPLLRGVPVVQVAANGTTEPAILSLSDDKFTVTITSTSSLPKTSGFFTKQQPTTRRDIDIGEMDRIQRGQSTQHFEKAIKKSERTLLKAELSRKTSEGSGSKASTGPSLDPKRSFSIIFRGAHTLDLMTESPKALDVICTALERILLDYQRGKIRVAQEVLLWRYVWFVDSSMDITKRKHYLGLADLRKLLQQINCVMKQRDLQAAYDHFGKVIGLDRLQRRRGLTFEQSATFLHKIKRDSWMVKPVTVIWKQFFGELMNNGKQRTTVSDKTVLHNFLHEGQGDVKATVVHVRKIFRRLHDMEIAHTSTEPIDSSRITKDQFEAYLYAAENDAFDPDKEKFDPSDMDQPISEYWINSSHNTYLIGDQYTSHSSVEMYSNALYRGCRCLELDIWDGGKSDGRPVPVVWHGHTMTTKIKFVEIIKAIKIFLNFHPDTFPIILSFENHCSIPYQEVIAEQLLRHFGDLLYVPTEVSLFGPLPTPAQLRGMVVIKGRRPDGTEADAYDTDDDLSEDGDEDSAEMEDRRSKLRKKHGVAPQLARLTLFHGHKLKTFDQSIRTPNYYMHSFSENKVRSNCRQKAAYRWIVHNQTHMSRTYPAGARVDSSNYNPLLAWCMGCQMVALNFQTQDNFLRLNDGRFRENGNCGYVLKPSSLMIKDDFSQTCGALQLSVRVLSGSCLPKPKGQRTGDCIDPYVKVAVYDVMNEEKEIITMYQTDVVQQNGFFPIWHQEKLQFTVEHWAVAMLQLTVHDKSRDDFIASSSIPISCLRRGIRSVKLYDATNTRSGVFDFASLLLDIDIGQVVAEI